MGLLDDLLGSGMPGGNTSKSVGGALLSLLANRTNGGGSDPNTDNSANHPSIVTDGLSALVQKFEQGGLADIANSWISSSGQNQPISPDQLHQALGSSTINALSERTGIHPDSLLPLLSQALPELVDRLTPRGQIPDQAEVSQRQQENKPIEV